MKFLLAIETFRSAYHFEAQNSDEFTDRMYDYGAMLPGLCQSEGRTLEDTTRQTGALYFLMPGEWFPEAVNVPYSFAAVGILRQPMLRWLYVGGQVADQVMLRAKDLFQAFDQRKRQEGVL